MALVLSLVVLAYMYCTVGRRYPWKPEMAFDDGCETYLKMPTAKYVSSLRQFNLQDKLFDIC